jgi:L-serine dehydratase
MLAFAAERGWGLGRTVRHYESRLLGLPEAELDAEMLRRYEVMRSAVALGLDDARASMPLCAPSAGTLLLADRDGRLPVGGLYARAAARGLAALHACNAKAVVCAAPTGGSSGVLPGVLVTLAEERGVDPGRIAAALWAAGGVGLILAVRGTFAAEEAGCQVEIGAASAMAAAAVVEAAGGTAAEAADAASIGFQNTIGLVCDPVGGGCEIPCHTRTAAGVAGAFLCADLIRGGYRNPISLDDAIDASIAAGRQLPPELRCTARGGVAATPSARSFLKRDV